MPQLRDGEEVEVQGSGTSRYQLKNAGGVYSCTCPAWRNQSVAIDRRTCKHLRAYLGDASETERTGEATARRPGSRTAGEGGAAAESAAAPSSSAPPVLLAHSWDGVADLSGWWMSEKLDGVRAYWDGRQFLSRLGNRYHAPAWFTAALPDHPLDGELWAGRKQFQDTVSVVRRADAGDAWRRIRFLVFDAPAVAGGFEDRLAHCRAVVERAAEASPSVALVEHQRCEGVDHLRAELARVEAAGGEGLMLRRPASPYVVGRSDVLLKVKTFFDGEARVVGHQAGAGRHKGRLGALEVELADGTRFGVGTGFSDAERAAPPPVGSLITFRYQELSSAGVPRFPIFVDVRHDAAGPSALAASSAKAAKAAAPAKPSKVAAPPAKPSETAAPASPIPSTGSARRFELVDGGSRKFWEITLVGDAFTTRYGKLGSDGQTTTKTFASADLAGKAHDKLVAEKVAKGYVEQTPKAIDALP